MKIYHYDDDGIFIHESEARESPLEKDVFLIPAKATKDVPPKIKNGFVQAWNFEEQKWEVWEDHRGTVVYSKTSGQPLTIQNKSKLYKENTQ